MYACSVVSSVASSGNTKVARSRHEFNHVQIATWLAIHTTCFSFEIKKVLGQCCSYYRSLNYRSFFLVVKLLAERFVHYCRFYRFTLFLRRSFECTSLWSPVKLYLFIRSGRYPVKTFWNQFCMHCAFCFPMYAWKVVTSR